MERRLLVMNSKDNVGVLLEQATAGDTCSYKGDSIEMTADIEFAHKVALMDIPATGRVIKYGHEIGYAEKEIHKGEWVHTHNMGCRRGK